MSDSPKILVVDDEQDNIKLLTDLCTKQGYRVVSARDGEEGIMVARDERPDVILLDLMMPRMDGMTALRALKQDAMTVEIPVIIVTALTDIDNKIKGTDIGAFDYVTKPFRFFEVTRRISAALQTRELRRRLLEAERELSAVKGADAVTGVEAFVQLSPVLEFELARARRYKRDVAVLMLAVEGIVEMRDRGEAKESVDRALAAVAGTLRATIRTVDRLFRTDFAEFALVLPETDGVGADACTGRLRAAVEKAHAGYTVTTGGSIFAGTGPSNGEAMLREAGQALASKRRKSA